MTTKTDRTMWMPGLSDRVVILTGAASGIGAAVARALVSAGAQVMLVDRDAEGLAKVSNSLDPGKTSSLVADVDTHDAPKRIVSATLAAFDSLTTLLHVAGVYHRVSVPKTTRDDFDIQLAINVQAPFWLTQAALPYLTNGQVVFVGSTAAYVGSAQGAAYCASKAAVLGMMRSLAVELAPHGVRVNAVAPGTTNTPINDGWLFGEDRQKVVDMIPDGRIGRPEDIVGALLFLISDLADHIHGQSVVIDGGLTIK